MTWQIGRVRRRRSRREANSGEEDEEGRRKRGGGEQGGKQAEEKENSLFASTGRFLSLVSLIFCFLVNSRSAETHWFSLERSEISLTCYLSLASENKHQLKCIRIQLFSRSAAACDSFAALYSFLDKTSLIFLFVRVFFFRCAFCVILYKRTFELPARYFPSFPNPLFFLFFSTAFMIVSLIFMKRKKTESPRRLFTIHIYIHLLKTILTFFRIVFFYTLFFVHICVD